MTRPDFHAVHHMKSASKQRNSRSSTSSQKMKVRKSATKVPAHLHGGHHRATMHGGNAVFGFFHGCFVGVATSVRSLLGRIGLGRKKERQSRSSTSSGSSSMKRSSSRGSSSMKRK